MGTMLTLGAGPGAHSAGGGGGGLPSYPQSSNIGFWGIGDQITGVDGDPVSSWPDVSVSSNTPTSSSTARPTLKTSIVNGHNVARFDGTNDILTFASDVSSLQWSSGFTIFCVYSVSSFSAFAYTVTRPVGNCFGVGTWFGPNRQVWAKIEADGPLTGYPTSNLTTGTWYIGQCVYIPGGGVGGGGNDFGMELTGSGLGANDSVIGSFTGKVNLSALTGIVSIGGFAPASRDFFAGDIAELIIWNVGLTDTQRGTVLSDLSTKYGIS